MSPNQTYCPIFPEWWLENWQMGKVGNQDCAIAGKILCPDCPRAARRSHTGGEVSPDVWNRVFALAPIAAFVLTHTCVHAHVSTLTHQIASPRHRFSALRHGVVTSCHGVLLMPTIVSYEYTEVLKRTYIPLLSNNSRVSPVQRHFGQLVACHIVFFARQFHSKLSPY